MAQHQIESLKYAGREIPVSEGLLTLVEENDAWSLWVITEEGWEPASIAHEAELRLTTKDGKLMTLRGQCTQATENSRYHFQGQGPVGIA
jgi:hypothetical protein